MVTKAATVYPSIVSFSGSAQTNIGPYNIPSAITLLRVEVHGLVNYQSVAATHPTVGANYLLWAVQWVPAGAGASNIITAADGDHFPIREQLGDTDLLTSWEPSTATAAVQSSLGLRASWAGQVPISPSVDLYLSFASPSGGSSSNANVFATLRFWWS